MRRKRVLDVCDICCDTAVGRNFGAITCISCKVFFRRNAFQNDILKCFADSKCIVNKKTRKVCKSCRLNACFKKGMRAALIKSKDSKLKSQLITDNTETTICVTTEGSLMSYRLNKLNNLLFNNINNNNHEVLIQLLFKPVFYKLDNFNSFNDLETKRFSELFRASNVFSHIPFYTQNKFEITDLGQLNNIANRSMDTDIQDIIKFAQQLSSFTSLCPNDQLALIKYGCLEILTLRYTILFDIDTNYWTLFWHSGSPRAGHFKLDLLKTEKRDLYSYYKNYLHKTIPEWNRDLVIFNLLTSIVLLNPNRPNLTHRDVVKCEQQGYIYLLQRYLYLKYKCEAQTKLSKLMNPLKDLQIICDIEKRNGIDYYLDSFGPILKEVLYDIPNN